MRSIFFLFCCCFVSAFAKAQSPQTSYNLTSPLVADNFYGVDDFNNLYYGKNNVFYKKAIDASLKIKTQEFYDVQLGDLTTVDIINPLKILLFYKDTQTVVLLDNRLNESQRIDLSAIKPYRYFDYASLAGERRLWLFNTDVDRIELYDYINDKLVVSSPIIKETINQMLTDYNFCHLLTDKGVLSFNSYGSKTARLEKEDIQLADFDFEKLVFLSNNKLESYKFNREYQFEKMENTWKLDVQETPQSLYLKNGKLYIYCFNRVSVLTD